MQPMLRDKSCPYLVCHLVLTILPAYLQYIVPVLPYVNSITSNTDLVRPNVNHTVPLYILILFPGILVPGISAFDK